jgi:hypothetical protein
VSRALLSRWPSSVTGRAYTEVLVNHDSRGRPPQKQNATAARPYNGTASATTAENPK